MRRLSVILAEEKKAVTAVPVFAVTESDRQSTTIVDEYKRRD